MEKTFSGKKILITGGTGYLASSLIGQLCMIDCHIIRVGLPGSSFDPVKGTARIDDIEGDVCCREFWEMYLHNVAYIFHLAAYEHKHGAVFNPILDFQVNALSTLYLLEACRIHTYTPFIVYASSSNIIGLPSQMPVDETFPENPLILFSIHKATSEKYLRYYAREFNLNSVALRLTNVYGPVPNRQISLRVVINKVIDLALQKQRLLVYQNSDCIRDYIWIEDAAAAFLEAARLGAKCAQGQYYIVGSGTGHRISDVWRKIAGKITHKTGIHIPLEEVLNEKLDAIEWRNFIADSSHFTALTGWKARMSLDEGLERTIDYFLNTRYPAL
jgi:UDP-glucose 4-epimerase